jgi:pimeloyl-ACP methyl ester carboxylesterase
VRNLTGVRRKRVSISTLFKADIEGCSVHFLHKVGVGSAPVPLVLTHGWPGSFLEFEMLIQHLTDPESYGGDPRDAFDVVVPSLPGFGFSSAPEGPGTNSRHIAELWHDLLQMLGSERYFAQGGDIGSGVSTWLGVLYPRNVVGVHLNYVPAGFRPPLGPGTPALSAEEREFHERAATFAAEEPSPS